MSEARPQPRRVGEEVWTVKLPPVLIYKSDLEALEELLTSRGIGIMEVLAGRPSDRYDYRSLAQLFEAEAPHRVVDLAIVTGMSTASPGGPIRFEGRRAEYPSMHDTAFDKSVQDILTRHRQTLPGWLLRAIGRYSVVQLIPYSERRTFWELHGETVLRGAFAIGGAVAGWLLNGLVA